MGEAAIQIGPERSSAFLERVKEMLPEGGNLDLPAILTLGVACDRADDFVIAADVQGVF